MQTQPILSRSLLTASAAVLCGFLVPTAHADTFGPVGPNQFTIDFVTIGNPGNANDSGTTGSSFTPYGRVAYEFRMGTYEISEDMINKANTLGGLLISKDTRGVNRAATSVSWNEAARFVNWLNVSSGYAPAYNFAVQPGGGGYTGNEDLVLWTVSDAGYDAGNLYRNSNAHYFLPSEHEWYKAAFYSGSGTLYYDYATGSDVIPTAVASGTGAGTAVYSGGGATEPADITQAGGLSPYGTMGQNGNVWEWAESAFDELNSSSSELRAFRGGDWVSSEFLLRSLIRSVNGPADSDNRVGFRVASVPEPTVSVSLMLAGGLWLARRKRPSAL